ncbi:maleylpyruvate isomerase family mycothiol-dependent enzyme [Rhodococcus sp. W8901]|uniref:maleylpyruvate isomerase family mycothiol-dependent enzyme n=1 Tax=Rhodococcus sp. W8901 TaxID=2742603 RepID=UPI001582DD8D|nr:maleylpyruvate isomerase family mycothiol-dependent enzyme [Rhodococcus sp. W8901]QKT13370.1 maleylpyruvate isomerase family mycothiol-dependent enzyme [Rhodococcus sp. W8901]
MAFNDLDLSERLDLAREGTAYFAQRLAAVSDADLSGPSLLEGWTRKHLVAHVGYNAAALCRILDWAATGVETPMYESMQQRAREIDEGATLSVGSLRNLFTHTAARLDEQWRTVPREAWAAQVRTAQGRMVPASETAWMRSREVWIHTVDLGNGGRFDEFPDVVLDSLLDDVVGMWRRRGDGAGLVLEVGGRRLVVVQEDAPVTGVVVGSLVSVVRWASGRGAVGLTAGSDLQPPRWL